MRRRDFTAGLLLAAGVPAAAAQQASTKRRIAIIVPAIPAAGITETGGYSYWRAFFAELRRLGDIEGKNLIVERYSAEGHPERYAELARQAASNRPDLILPADTPIALAARSATRSIPIIALMGDPLRYGLVRSLARPGGNLTGVSFDAGLRAYAKPLQFLKEAVPSASRIAVLAMRATWKDPLVPYMRAASRQLGISLIEEPLAKGTPSAIGIAFAAILRARPDALYISYDPVFYVHRRLVLDFLEKNRLPASFLWNEIVEEGGLMSYGTDTPDLFRRWAGIVHQVLLGAKPGDIPISQPTKFLFAINLRTANALGLAIPRSLLALADEVVK
jgi:putative ABC transport system substrate-binding protein